MGIDNIGLSIHGTVQHDTTVPVISSGTYDGNSSVNRAVAHGLGRIPKLVFIADITGGIWRNFIIGGYLCGSYSTGDANYDVTDPDATNFYVGNAADYSQSANNLTRTYKYVLWG